MSNWWDRVDWRDEALDHLGHMALGMLANVHLIPIYWVVSEWWVLGPAVFQALWSGYRREQRQMARSMDDEFGSKRAVDVIAHAPGGALIAALCIGLS